MHRQLHVDATDGAARGVGAVSMRDKIASIIWHDRQGQNTPESVADAILATIKADDDAKYKQGFDDGCAHMKEDYDAGRRLDENTKDKRIEELELQQSKDWSNINVKADFIDKCLNDIALQDERIDKLTESMRAIDGWGVGPSGSTTAERSMRRIAAQALAELKGTANEQ